MNEPGQIVAYWLCPAEPERSHFDAIIRELAERFGAPVFEPHVTAYVTSLENEDPAAMIEQAAVGCRRLRLLVHDLDYSDKFTQTLFVRFHSDTEVTSLSEALRRASVSQEAYELNPHLSLIYKNMDPETQRDLAASLTLPFAEVTFESVKAVISSGEITSREQVEAWRVVAEAKLA